MNTSEFKQKRVEFQKELVRQNLWVTCLNCEEFSGNKCSKWGMTPPPEVILHGCEHHLQVIPF